jgi:hypothetical protein
LEKRLKFLNAWCDSLSNMGLWIKKRIGFIVPYGSVL